MKKKTSGRKGRAKSTGRKKHKKEKIEALLQSLLDKERLIKHAEDALLESIRHLRDIFEQSPIGIGLHDDKGELLIVNGSYLKIFGLNSFGDIKHQNLFKMPEFPKKEARRLRAGKVVQYEVEYDFEELGHVLFIVSPLFREKKIIG
ncbi:MAG: PAS domain S-box protein, partial [Candidatus Omnitrophota bacterium]